jgi:pyruvate kinase
MRRTKIVCTLGPASFSTPVLRGLLEAGMNMARLNCSHVKHPLELEDHIENLRRVSRLTDHPLGILLDLGGPKVRSGYLVDKTMDLVVGERLRIVPGEAEGRDDWITSSHQGLADDVSAGHRILLDDGLMELRVTKVDRERVVHTEVVVGGTLKTRKGMNLPDSTVSIPALTEKDKCDLAGGLDLGVDYVALSFVQTRQDVQDLKNEMHTIGIAAPIIAKIEKPQAIDNLDGIMDEVDGIMVARGDLAVEVGNHRVPILQKDMLARSSHRGILDIVATQMLDSMTHNPRPTRAEASDVANAILDGCDAVMLSGETAAGDYPIESVQMMDRIACEVEPWMNSTEPFYPTGTNEPPITMAVVKAAADIARAGAFKALIVFTLSGRTARLLSGFYARTPIFAMTPRVETARAMCLYRGVVPVHMPFPANSDAMIAQAEQALVHKGFLEEGDVCIVVAGFTDLKGVANMVKIVQLGPDADATMF